MEGVLHCSRPDRVLAGCNASVPVSLDEELEEEDRVIDIGEGGVGSDGIAEVGPDGPGTVLGVGAWRNDSGIECCPEQAKVSMDCIILLRQHKHQGSGCEYVRSK
jgi:hypothetical protein